MSLDLSNAERYMLAHGLKGWDGPTECTESLARAFGFSDLEEFVDDGKRIADAIWRREPLTTDDWTRALFALEVGWVSVVVGYANEWYSVHGWSDGRSLAVLRSLQRKIPWQREAVGP
ncbi:hypothetical protein FE697_020075 [Mumia zhuanghuii]|uniref:Uncharacterized protein n=2 Tax=Mumia TaxID=1546255 RepID=A0ABW1QK21_9ACTN|nr:MULTISPECIES: hypothetical protein [Mumia]KAA1418142.1 hypothetical protein FE697_020075 [Mumia zhuanghuii]